MTGRDDTMQVLSGQSAPDAGASPPSKAAAPEALAAGILLWRPHEDGEPRFLLLETRLAGHYSPPKGHLDEGETFVDAALRETREECGLAPRSLDPELRLELAYDVVKKGRPRRKRVLYFLGEAEDGPVRLSEEHTDYRWEPLAHIRRIVPFPSLREAFEAARARLAALGKAPAEVPHP